MDWCLVFLGLAFSVVGGDLVLHNLIDLFLWPKFYEVHNLPPPPVFPLTKRVGWLVFPLTRQVGWLERFLYTLAIYVGVWQWIGVWLAIKVAARWRSTQERPYGPADNIWLIGTGLSVLFGFVGAWVALGLLPLKGIIHIH